MSAKLFWSAVIKFIFGIFLVGVLIFLPAGTFNYVNGWIFMGVLFIPMLFAGIVMMFKDPELLKRRLNAKERLSEQGIVIKLSGLMFVLGFVSAGLDFRFDVFILPRSVTIASAVLFLCSYLMFAEVLRENTYLSRTIEVCEGQKVIDKGLYGIVRHPMYSATLILFMTMPLILGSLISFAFFLAYPFIISARIRSEERFLEKELDGYSDYMKRVKYRLIPFIW